MYIRVLISHMKTGVLFFIFCLSMSFSVSQTNFYASYGQRGEVRDLALTLDGGTIQFVKDTVLGFRKTDIGGNVQWEWYQSFGYAFCKNIIQTDDSGFVFATEGTGCYITKLDKNGILLWNKEYGSFALTTGICKGMNGGFVVGYNMNGMQNCLVSCDINGNIIWQRSYEQANNQVGQSISRINQNVVVLGKFGNSTNFDLTLTSVDLSTGNLNFHKLFSVPGYAEWPTQFGGPYLTPGQEMVFAAQAQDPNLSFGRFLVIKTDLAGNVVWSKLLSSDKSMFPTDITVLQNGLIVATGSIGYTDIRNTQMINICLTPGGAVRWANAAGNVTLSGQGADWSQCIASNGFEMYVGGFADYGCLSKIDSNGNGWCSKDTVIITPYSHTLAVSSPSISVTNLSNSVTNRNFQTQNISSSIIFHCVSSVASQNEVIRDLSVFPNPCANVLTTSFSHDISNGTFEVYDLHSKLLFSSPIINTRKFVFDMRGLTEGVYLIRVVDSRGRSEGILVQRDREF